MGEETRHRTVIEFAADDAPMESVLQRMESRINAIADRAAGMFGGGPGSGGGGVGGMPVAPPAPSSPLLFPGGGGAGSPMAPAAPASPLLYDASGRPMGPSGGAPPAPGTGPVPLPQAPPSPAVYAPQGGASGPGGMPGGGGSSAAYDAYWEGMNADREDRNRRRLENEQKRAANRPGMTGDLVAMSQAAGNGMMGFHPGMPLMAATALGTSFLGRQSSAAADAGNSSTSRALGVAAAGLGLFGGALAAGLSMRYGTAQERGSVDMLRAQGRVSGSDVDLDAGAELGYSPAESAGLNYQYSNAAGHSGSGDRLERTTGPLSGSALLDMTRLGISPGAMGAYAGMWAPGGGAVGGASSSVTSMAAVASGNGLRGSKIDQWLQTIAAHTGRMAEGGLDVNMDKFESFIRRMNGTSAFGDYASQMPRYAASLDGARQGARQQVFGGMEQMVQDALVAKALQQPGGLTGAMHYFENAGPGDAVSATKDIAGDFAPYAIAMQSGMPIDQAKRMVRGLGKERGGILPDFPDEALEVSRTMAQADNARLKTVSSASAKDLVESVEAMKDGLNVAGKIGQDLITAIKDLIEALGPKKPGGKPKTFGPAPDDAPPQDLNIYQKIGP